MVRRLDKLAGRLAAGRRCAQQNIVLVGDSLCSPRAAVNLSRLLRTSAPPVGVVACAENGLEITKLSDLITSAARRPPPESVIGVIVLAGGNDAKRGRVPDPHGLGDALGRAIEDIRKKWPSAFVVLCTIPVPGAHPALRTDAAEITTGILNPALRATARTQRVALCDVEDVFEGLPDVRSDGVHPTASGDALLAERWFQSVRPWLARPGASGDVHLDSPPLNPVP
ncbi:MAG: SGNH/GDSL hydrolase family protein [Candidatus Eisenbacteria bacterium]|jgi:hypothetical protein|nr:SGNH/GDSL hydrolase family protein [Candidatus Eisenbacteria bacterium]